MVIYLMVTAALVSQASAQVNVWTYHNDNARTGQNLDEKDLTPANVHQGKFGPLLRLPVDGAIYAQPLVLSGVLLGDRRRNIVFVATEQDSMYAVDADTGDSLWFVSFLRAGVAPIFSPDDPGRNVLNCEDIVPDVGITGTPVIDVDQNYLPNSTLYVVSKTQEADGADISYVQRLHALDVATGREKFGGPVVIEASVAGSGNGADDDGWHDHAHKGHQGDSDGHGRIYFDSLRQHQRAGLLLADGVVYVAWAAHGDQFPYHGWLLGYDARTLKQVYVFNSTPNGGEAGIWQSGVAPAADEDGNIYAATGNGSFNPGAGDYGDSVIKLRARDGELRVVDFFTPCSQSVLDVSDQDLGSGAPLLIPLQPGSRRSLLFMSGKDRTIYLIDRSRLGGFAATKDDVVQEISTVPPCNMQKVGMWYGQGAYFNHSIYLIGVPPIPKRNSGFLDRLKIAADKVTIQATTKQQFGDHTSSPSISAHGASAGIVWYLQAEGFRPNKFPVLHAFDATSLVELYTSANDKNPGNEVGVKFSVPTIANGKVYFGTSSALYVYGRVQ